MRRETVARKDYARRVIEDIKIILIEMFLQSYSGIFLGYIFMLSQHFHDFICADSTKITGILDSLPMDILARVVALQFNDDQGAGPVHRQKVPLGP